MPFAETVKDFWLNTSVVGNMGSCCMAFIIVWYVCELG